MHYRNIWISEFGPIPKDSSGRSYEIHHIDGNHSNNDICNLECLSIEEHYNIHHSQNDWGACFAISKRLKRTPDEISNLLRGKKSPLKGKTYEELYGKEKAEKLKKSVSEKNKGRKYSRETLLNWSRIRKGKIVNKTKLTIEDVQFIKSVLMYKPFLKEQKRVGETQKNGLILTYIRLLSYELLEYYPQLGDSTPIYNILTNKSWKNVQIQF